MARKKTNKGNTADTPKIEFAVTPQGGQGRGQVFARLKDETLHVDKFDLTSQRSRRTFLKRVGEEAEKRNADFDATKSEELLMKLAYDLTCNDPAATTDQDGAKIDADEILKAFRIDVLGEQEDQSIVCWVRSSRKRWTIKNPSRWSIEEMYQALGDKALDKLWDGPRGKPAGTYTPSELKRAVALAAAKAKRMGQRNLFGQGIWGHKGDFLIVNGARAWLYGGYDFREIKEPKLDDKIIDFDGSKVWTTNLPLSTRGMGLTKAQRIIGRVGRQVDKWNWSHPWDAKIVTALIPATFIQACWTWRPLVSIIGGSDTGKSTFIADLLTPLFGRWTIAADRSTEAGLRQAIRHHAAPVLIDEFDRYKQRQQVLELFRTSSRRGTILRGTQDQEGQEFGVRHIPWFAAIESGDIWGQDSNRFIRLELNPPENRGKLVLPGEAELAKLCRQLAAVALWAAPAAVKLADSIKGTGIEGVHGRLVESFSVPAAIDAVVSKGRNVTRETAVSILRRMLEGRELQLSQGESNEVQLLRDILSANIRVTVDTGSSKESCERSVAQLLEDSYGAHKADLEAKGIRIIERRSRGNEKQSGEPAKALFLVPDVIRSRLLVGTRWSQSRIDQLLARLPGAERSQQRCGGQRRSGVLLPWPGCLECLDAV